MCQTRTHMKSGVNVIIEAIDVLSELFVREVVEIIDQARNKNRCAGLAISGGSVADRFLPSLCQLGEGLEHLEIFWCDERAVPVTDSQSNYHQAKQLWFDPAGLSLARVFPMFQGTDLEQAAMDYELVLRKRAERPLDLVLLGLGPDGHIASLFPGSAILGSRRWVEPVYQAPKPPPERVTLTLNLLASTPHVVVAAFGESKASVVAGALTNDSDLPLAQLLRQAPHAVLFLDHAAASKLPSTGSTQY